MGNDSIMLSIADIGISLECDRTDVSNETRRMFDAFLRDKVAVDFSLHAHYQDIPDLTLDKKELLFDSQGTWSLYKYKQQVVYIQRDALDREGKSYSTVFLDKALSKGDFYGSIASGSVLSSEDYLPLDHPFGEVLLISLLAKKRGAMLHACGIEDNGNGYLFLGNSGQGKSTMASLWKDKAHVLNDDRIVVREEENSFFFYGTPWHGEASICPSGHRVPLHKLFFLNHGLSNSIDRLSSAQIISKLLTRSFMPLWDENGMAFNLEFFDKLVNAIPGFDLSFLPDNNVVDLIRRQQ